MSLVAFMSQQLWTTKTHAPVLMLREMEQALVVAFLETVPHSYTDILKRPPVDTMLNHVRRIEEFIDANWRSPLSIEELARVTGVGVINSNMSTGSCRFKRDRLNR